LLATRPTPKVDDHPLSAVLDCLFNIVAATLHIWKPSPPSATRHRTVLWWHRVKLQSFVHCLTRWSRIL